MQRQPSRQPEPRKPRWHDCQAQPVRPGSPVYSKKLRGALLYEPTAADPANVFYQEPKEVLVRRERNVSKPSRKGVHVPAFPVDRRGLKLRVSLKIMRLVKEGKMPPLPPPTPKTKAHVSKRQIRLEFIEGSIADADVIAKQRSDERLERRAAEARSTVKLGQWVIVTGRQVFVCEIGHLLLKGEA